ncbi:helix-turn-helix domain-containing protein (plasmid) [Lichenicola cladoniae]|uniref:Helix-turn-helix domain-containing protein n=1 Tax=Lichenicola cladoniae TaxID=1484109 RepID=A0A6M8HZS5_9PROT|nr:helix-turn-helix domain-containing protein [Lichenicola cladoniae]NPD69776.1 helix-turn-helix domain-containing protein [Acetobacteraceae bacterium]QKE94039.1 helix-turn-helix domain-containing protein [Lichenicola cladoniae]
MTGKLMGRIGRPKRDKVFGEGRAIPLDRNAKARIWAYALARTAKLRRPGQHRGPLSRATLDVLRTLLWHFHNRSTGRCFPSYERIADSARVHRATVARAIAALEREGVLTWENRLVRQRVAIEGLFGRQWVMVPRRTSNAYCFYDYRRDAFGRPVDPSSSPKSQNSTETIIQENQKLAREQAECGATIPLDPSNPLEAALLRLSQVMR